MRTATEMSGTRRFRAICVICRVEFDSTPEASDHHHLTLPRPRRQQRNITKRSMLAVSRTR